MLTLIWCHFHLRVTAVARKIHRSFCQKCRWQVTPKHAYTFDPTKSEWADCVAVQAWCGYLSEKFTRNSSRKTWPQSSQLAEPLWTDPGVRSGINVCELISTTKEEKKHRQGMNDQTFSPKPRKRGKATTIRLVRDARMVPWLTEIPIRSLPKAANRLSVLSKQL